MLKNLTVPTGMGNLPFKPNADVLLARIGQQSQAEKGKKER
jgi:hypothetical protein